MTEIELKGINEKIYYDECSNGLKIFMWQNKKVNTFYATLSVKFGSINNKYRVNGKVYTSPSGVAHFLEHVKFNEEKDVTAHDYFFKMGSDTNAFTTFNYTNYQVFGSNNPKDNILHLVNFVLNPYFTNSIINKEKGIIIEEAKMGQDDPYTSSLFHHLKNIFYSNDHKELITGSPEDIKKINIKNIENAYNYYYHPENMFLVVTGNFNPYEISETIKENETKKSYNTFELPERIIGREPKRVKKNYEEMTCNVQSRKIKIGIKIAKSNFKSFDDLHIRMLLSIILRANFGNTSDFKDELLQKELINSMSYMAEFFDNYIIILFTIDSPYKEEIIKLFKSTLSNLQVSEDTFNRMVKASIATVILDYEDVEYVNELIQQEILNYGEIIPNLKEKYEKLKYNNLQKFLNSLDTSNQSILILDPKS